mgnify:CR=1 FL=1
MLTWDDYNQEENSTVAAPEPAKTAPLAPDAPLSTDCRPTEPLAPPALPPPRAPRNISTEIAAAGLRGAGSTFRVQHIF